MSTEKSKDPVPDAATITAAEYWKMMTLMKQHELQRNAADHAQQLAALAFQDQTAYADELRKKYSVAKLNGFRIQQTGEDSFIFAAVE